MSAIVFFVIGCCILIPNIDATLEATVFLKTTGAVDIQALKNVAGVSAVYRVKPLFFYSADEKGEELKHRWNYIVVGKGLEDTAAQDKLISDVGAMDSVKLHAGYRLSAYPRFGVDMLNAWIKKADPKYFVKRPMKSASPKPRCHGMHLKKGESLKVISIARRGNGKMMMKMGREMIMRIFPALKASYTFIGQVDSSDVWDDFTVMDYNNMDTWCEYVQSQWAKEFRTRYPGVFKGFGLGLAVQV